MSINVENENRQIIPRWTPVKNSRIYGVNIGSSDILIDDEYDPGFTRCLEDWKERKDLISAKELVSYSTNMKPIDNSDFNEAVEYIKEKDSSPIFKEILSHHSDIEDCDDIKSNETPLLDYYSGIHNIKAHLKRYQYDAYTWLDLSYYYTVLGQYEKAQQALITSLGLNKSNRLLLRSASRFYLHYDDPELASNLLKKSGLVKSDPWIASAYLSITQAYDLRFERIKDLRFLSKDENLSFLQRSELNGALSTLEFNSGSIKIGKKHLSLSLEDPTENTLAQAQYLCSKYDGEFRPSDYRVPMKHEALALQFFNSGKYELANLESKKWFNYQPFSSKPALLSSYLMSVHLDKQEESIEIIDRALLSSQGDPILVNNKAFSLVQMNRIQDAEKVINSINISDLDSDELATVTATYGSIELGKGNSENGDQLYEKAINFFARKRDQLSLARVYYFYGMQLLKNDKKKGIVQLQKSAKISTQLKNNEMVLLTKKYAKNN